MSNLAAEVHGTGGAILLYETSVTKEEEGIFSGGEEVE